MNFSYPNPGMHPIALNWHGISFDIVLANIYVQLKFIRDYVKFIRVIFCNYNIKFFIGIH